MGTQGLISIVKNGHTFIKIVCGCNGYNAEKLGKIIKHKNLENPYKIYELALNLHFGCKDCLVVMNNDDIIFDGDKDELPLYRETFDKPSFNPRWKYGTTDYLYVIYM